MPPKPSPWHCEFDPHVHVYTPERPGTVTQLVPEAQLAPQEPQCVRDASDTHEPPQQWVPPLSLHVVPLARSVCVQPVDALQPSVVQSRLSLQLRAAPVQRPAEHTSFTVHALPSLHAAVLFVCTHAHVVALNESVVHTFGSAHEVE